MDRPGLYGALVLCAVLAAPASAQNTSLTVEQIGSDNVSAAWQGQVPQAGAVAEALGVNPDALSFAVHQPGALTMSEGEAGPMERTLGELLDEFSGLSGGSNNSARLVQHGARNRALQVQAGGSDNSMLTAQYGSDNIAVHLHRGDGNATEMLQYGHGNETTLIATGGATGAHGEALRMEVAGGVHGFALRASGPQSYSTISVRPNGTGGHDVQFR